MGTVTRNKRGSGKRKKTITGPTLPLADTAASRSLNPVNQLITLLSECVKRVFTMFCYLLDTSKIKKIILIYPKSYKLNCMKEI